MLLEEVVQLQRSTVGNHVEKIDGPEVDEGEEKGNESVPKEPGTTVDAGEVRDHDDVHRLVVLCCAAEGRGASKAHRMPLVSMESGDERVGCDFPGLVRDAGNNLYSLEFTVGGTEAVYEIPKTDEESSKNHRYNARPIVVIGTSVFSSQIGVC